MEDILASIRRILSEDEAQPGEATPLPPAAEAAPSAPHIAEPAGDGVLVLDAAMMVPEPPPSPAIIQMPAPEPMPTVQAPMPVASGLVAPEAAAAAGASVGNLLRTLSMERSMQVRTGGPTIEDIVREEIRPLLKEWLDANLPPMVERLVRAEIERVVGRAVP
jgi:hypothetical protein